MSKVEFLNYIFLILKRKEIELDNYLICVWIRVLKFSPDNIKSGATYDLGVNLWKGWELHRAVW